MAAIHEMHRAGDPSPKKKDLLENSPEALILLVPEEDLEKINRQYLEDLISKLDILEKKSSRFLRNEKIDKNRFLQNGVDASDSLVISTAYIWNWNLDLLEGRGPRIFRLVKNIDEVTNSQLRSALELSWRCLEARPQDNNLLDLIKYAKSIDKNKIKQSRPPKLNRNGGPNAEIHSGVTNITEPLFEFD